jgi:hypothetical protein
VGGAQVALVLTSMLKALSSNSSTNPHQKSFYSARKTENRVISKFKMEESNIKTNNLIEK